jgi:LPS sulfotransferase NodH
MPIQQIPAGVRPTAADLTGAAYDLPSQTPAERTLIICAAPKSGGEELSRLLLAAGAGIPHEYFDPAIARKIAERWELPGDPLEPKYGEFYLQLLKLQRGRNGVFAVNLRYPQYIEYLRNRLGARLFHGAVVLHLFCTDIVEQVTAWRAAAHTGVWDASGAQTSEPRPYADSREENIELFDLDLDALLGDDAGFRKLFAFAGIKPVFLTTDQLMAMPREITSDLARLIGVEPDVAALDAAIALNAPDPIEENERREAYDDIAADLKRRAFRL